MSDYREYEDESRKPRPVPNKSKKAPPASKTAPSAPANNNSRGGGGKQQQSGGGKREPQMILQQVDLSELATEEALQEEKRRQAMEIKEGVQDIKDCYDEFSTLVNHQQQGIDASSKNVESAVTNVQAGTDQLKQAQEHQKSSRKRMCCIVAILVALIIVVVVVIVVLKK